MDAADGAFAERFAAAAEEFGRAPACTGIELPRAFDQARAIEQAAEVLLVQFKASDGFDQPLQMQKREQLRREFEDHRAIFDFGAEAPDRGGEDAAVI